MGTKRKFSSDGFYLLSVLGGDFMGRVRRRQKVLIF